MKAILPTTLEEQTYRDLLRAIVPGDLPHRDYAPFISSVRYVETLGNTMEYFVPNSYNGWSNYFQFQDWDEQVKDQSLNVTEAARVLLWAGNIKIHCTCPAFHFWGGQYILTQLDAAIVPEERFPHIRNPHLRGISCKHLRRSIKVLPFHLGDMAKAIAIQRRHYLLSR